MLIRGALGSGLAAMALVSGFTGTTSAQAGSARERPSTPAAVLFRSTIFGAGTGLALGGAYAFVHQGTDVDEVLRRSTSGGAAAGFLVGLVYLVARSDPEGSVDEPGAVQVDEEGFRFSVIGLVPSKHRDLADVRGTSHDFTVLRWRFGGSAP